MGIDKPDDMDEIHAVVGHAVSYLLKSGHSAGVKEIVAFLQQQEAQSVNGQREVYSRAVRIVMATVN
ncbi:hypothetical protein [Pantoea sp. C2G6]|uniref:hypothetical protein n=1 Tax=Pantoea sp. C2G6 TaxID=3243084 RepID=UPI003ED846B9